MRTITEFVREAAISYGIDLTVPQRSEAITQLREAGFDQDQIPDKDVSVALDIFLGAAATAAARNNSQERTAGLTEPNHTPTNSVINRATYGRCPRCGGPTTSASLHSGATTEYCPACRISMPNSAL